MASKKTSKVATNNDMTIKIVIIAAFIVAFIGGFLIARAKYKPQIVQLTQMNTDKDAAMQQMKANANKIQMKDSKMWVIESGVAKEMSNDVVLSNGVKVKTDGTVMKADGTTSKMSNGDSIDMDGNMLPNTGTNADTNMQQSGGNTGY